MPDDDAVLLTARSAAPGTTVFAVEELFALLGSPVEAATAAVFEIVDPAVESAAFTISVKVAEAPGFKGDALQAIEPVAPAAGVEQEKDGPVFFAKDMNVVPGGRTSLSDTACAGSGPAFVTVKL